MILTRHTDPLNCNLSQKIPHDGLQRNFTWSKLAPNTDVDIGHKPNALKILHLQTYLKINRISYEFMHQKMVRDEILYDVHEYNYHIRIISGKLKVSTPFQQIFDSVKLKQLYLIFQRGLS